MEGTGIMALNGWHLMSVWRMAKAGKRNWRQQTTLFQRKKACGVAGNRNVKSQSANVA
jgi:hypothetical protein